MNEPIPRSVAEVWESMRAGMNPPFCPFCGAGCLDGSWKGPLGQGHGIKNDCRGEWRWHCENCGESGTWEPSSVYKSDPFIKGTAFWNPEPEERK